MLHICCVCGDGHIHMCSGTQCVFRNMVISLPLLAQEKQLHDNSGSITHFEHCRCTLSSSLQRKYYFTESRKQRWVQRQDAATNEGTVACIAKNMVQVDSGVDRTSMARPARIITHICCSRTHINDLTVLRLYVCLRTLSNQFTEA